MPDPADVHVTNCGTVYVFDLLTDAASRWAAEHVPDAEPGTLYVEHRFARDIADGMLADGLRVE